MMSAHRPHSDTDRRTWWFCIPCGSSNRQGDAFCAMCGRRKRDAVDVARWERFFRADAVIVEAAHVNE